MTHSICINNIKWGSQFLFQWAPVEFGPAIGSARWVWMQKEAEHIRLGPPREGFRALCSSYGN